MSTRINKVNQVLQEELARLIQKEFKEDFITVVSVECAKDLRNAKVWISTFSDKKGVLNKLKAKAPEFQHFLGKALFIKNTPRLSFHLDKGEERAARIEEILRKR